MLFGVDTSTWGSVRPFWYYIYIPGMLQEIHPKSVINTDSVKINTSLLMMRECQINVICYDKSVAASVWKGSFSFQKQLLPTFLLFRWRASLTRQRCAMKMYLWVFLWKRMFPDGSDLNTFFLYKVYIHDSKSTTATIIQQPEFDKESNFCLGLVLSLLLYQKKFSFTLGGGVSIYFMIFASVDNYLCILSIYFTISVFL